MNHPNRQMCMAFRRPTTLLVKVTPKGFVLSALDEEPVAELTGRIVKIRVIRKRFEDGVLVCDAPDGTHARNGTTCGQCQHPRCRPLLRCHLADRGIVYVIDLAYTSAENLFAIEDQAADAGDQLEAWHLRLRIVDRGYWGEVQFVRES